jgi:hypothetical protein
MVSMVPRHILSFLSMDWSRNLAKIWCIDVRQFSAHELDPASDHPEPEFSPQASGIE